MAIIRFSTLVNNQSIAFDRFNDVLVFDDASISAGAVAINISSQLRDNISFTVQGKTVLLPSTLQIGMLNTANFAFADGSVFAFDSTFSSASLLRTINVQSMGSDSIDF